MFIFLIHTLPNTLMVNQSWSKVLYANMFVTIGLTVPEGSMKGGAPHKNVQIRCNWNVRIQLYVLPWRMFVMKSGIVHLMMMNIFVIFSPKHVQETAHAYCSIPLQTQQQNCFGNSSNQLLAAVHKTFNQILSWTNSSDQENSSDLIRQSESYSFTIAIPHRTISVCRDILKAEKILERKFTPSCSWDDEADCQKNVLC